MMNDIYLEIHETGGTESQVDFMLKNVYEIV